MIPGMDPRAMAKLMNQMGIKNSEIKSTRVVIERADGGRLVVESPQVMEINMQGQRMFQVSGAVSEGKAGESGGSAEEGGGKEGAPSEEDILIVMQQANVPREEAISALQSAKGDIAQAIMNLQEPAAD
jgi:nascent polypeptide-associated complex subunit alpha